MFAKTQFLENGNQQACWEKVKVVSDVILYTHSLSLFFFFFFSFFFSVANEIFQLHVCLDPATTGIDGNK